MEKDIQNDNIENEHIANEHIENEDIENEDIENEDIANESIGDDNIRDSEKLEDVEFEQIDEEEIDEDEINEDSILSLEGILEELKKSNKELVDENNKLKNELDTIKDRILRISAEYDNFRKRTIKEKEELYSNACEDVLKNMLPVMDNLERAISVEGNSEDIKKGIEMTMRQFRASLENLQVEEISTEGEFDPNFHNAVMHTEDERFGKNQVVEVFLKGYKRGDKVLRHSMVRVAN